MSTNKAFEAFLNASHDELAKVSATEYPLIKTYMFDNVEKTVLAEYTLKGRKYIVTDSLDQNGYSKTEVFILGEGDCLCIPDPDDPYYGILNSIAQSKLPYDVIG